MKSGLKSYICEWEDNLNIPLINKTADAPLVDYIIDAWKSLEVVEQIKFVGYDYTEKESEIDINKHIFKREKKKKKKDRHDIKFIDDDRCGKLTVYLEITMLETDPSTGKTTYQKYPIKKAMLIPLQDKNGYFQVKGKKYYLIYQMVEKSTYTSNSSVTLKSLMPIAVKRNTIQVKDIDDNEYILPCYYVFVFRKEIPIILFYLSKGIKYTLDYLHVFDVVNFIEKLPSVRDEGKIYFPLSSKCFLVVDKAMFKKYPYVQSVVGAFATVCTNRVTLTQLDTPREWIKRIAVPNNYDKGNGILKYFNRLLDETTKKILKLPDYYTEDIYALLRWNMENFNDLRLKDNCDLANKRLRCNEYIASLLTKEFSKRLNRIISMGDKVTIDNIKELFKFPGDILLQKMHLSGVLRYDDTVNDMTFWSQLKYTSKGPHSLGGNNSNNIGIKYRDLHPSMLGNLDILVCGNSDPGTSGIISPFSNIDGLYFNSDDEPDEVYFEMIKDIEKRVTEEGKTFIKCDFESANDYYHMLDILKDYTDDNISIYGTSRENHYEIVINEDSDMDDNTKPMTVALRKKKKSDKK